MDVRRWVAWVGLACAPLAASLCLATAASTASQVRESFAIDLAVVFAASLAGAIAASYLTFLTLASVTLAALGSRHRASAAMRRITPRTWRALLASALGASLVAGATLPAAASPVDPSPSPQAVALGWAPVPSGPVADAPAAGPLFAESPAASPEPSPIAPVEAANDQTAASALGLGFATTGGPAQAQPDAVTASGAAGTYTVERGDSLWKITQRMLGEDASIDQIAAAWPVLYESNRGVIGGNPSLIFAGQVLQIPASLA